MNKTPTLANIVTNAFNTDYTAGQAVARMEKRGLWHHANPAPPWDYRQAKRQRMKDLMPFTGKSEVKESQ